MAMFNVQQAKGEGEGEGLRLGNDVDGKLAYWVSEMRMGREWASDW